MAHPRTGMIFECVTAIVESPFRPAVEFDIQPFNIAEKNKEPCRLFYIFLIHARLADFQVVDGLLVLDLLSIDIYTGTTFV